MMVYNLANTDMKKMISKKNNLNNYVNNQLNKDLLMGMEKKRAIDLGLAGNSEHPQTGSLKNRDCHWLTRKKSHRYDCTLRKGMVILWP